MQKPFSIQLELYFAHARKTAINYIAADEKTMPLYIQLLKNGAPFALPDGAIVEINFENPDGLRFPRLGTIQNHEQGKILYEIEPGDIAISGQMKASITVVNDAQRLTWQDFEFSVSRNLSDNQVEPPEVLGPWKNAIEERLSEHEGRLSNHDRRIVALEEHETDIDIDLSGIKSTLDEVLAAIAELQTTATEARNIANNAASTAAAAGYRAEDGIRRADSAQADVDTLAVRVAALE